MSKDIHYEEIRRMYYDPKNGYIGADKLFHKLKYQGITRNEIKTFIKNQEVYQIHKTVYANGSFIAPYALYEFQIDLIYLEDTHLNDTSYGLCCIDVFSKKADIELMKRKDEANTVQAMTKIFKRMGIPEFIYSDEGTEFKSSEFKKLCQNNKVDIIYTLRHAPVVERFNRTIKAILYKYLNVSKSKTITNVLPLILDNYNSSYHKTIKMAPNDVTDSNENEVYLNIQSVSNTVKREPVNIGDTVRVLLKEKAFNKKYKPSWSTTLHKVTQIPDEDTLYYKVEDLPKGYLRPYIMKINNHESENVEPLLENTREGHLKQIAKDRPKRENQPFETIAKSRTRREIKKPDKYTF